MNKIGEVHFRFLGANRFHAKVKNERFTAMGSRWRQNLKKWKFQAVDWQPTSKNCTKKRAARAARLFFPIQPIKSLISGVVVVVAVIIF